MTNALPHVLGLNTPNLIPQSILTINIDWARPAGRLIWSSLIFLIGLAIVGFLTTRPKPAEPATWAKTIVGAMLTWVLLILGYGTIPHEWLNFASGYLNFGTDTFLLRQNSVVPFDITRQVVSHVIVVGIYGFVLTTNVALFARWQKRPVATAAPEGDGEGESIETGGIKRWMRRRQRGTSAYGRPVTVSE
jgi:hypothetical protein